MELHSRGISKTKPSPRYCVFFHTTFDKTSPTHCRYVRMKVSNSDMSYLEIPELSMDLRFGVSRNIWTSPREDFSCLLVATLLILLSNSDSNWRLQVVVRVVFYPINVVMVKMYDLEESVEKEKNALIRHVQSNIEYSKILEHSQSQRSEKQ